MTKLDTLENQARTVFLGIGSNLGNRFHNIEITKYKLYTNNIKIIKSSSYYETLSWPDPTKPKFINIVIEVQAFYSPQSLLNICKKIEKEMGRKFGEKNSPRECDIDIIDYDGIKSKKEIFIPHKLMHKRNFVLIPLYEINKNWKHSIFKKNIKQLINLLPDKDIQTIKQI